jgi:hypothetical protein
MPVNLKPAKPGSYEGKRDYLTVETLLYKVEQYLFLVQVGAPEQPINDATKIHASPHCSRRRQRELNLKYLRTIKYLSSSLPSRV